MQIINWRLSKWIINDKINKHCKQYAVIIIQLG